MITFAAVDYPGAQPILNSDHWKESLIFRFPLAIPAHEIG